MLTRKYLKSILYYDPDSGSWTWLVSRGRQKAGSAAGSMNGKRRKIKIAGRMYFTNRSAWFYMKGYWPTRQVDHKDNNQKNERWNNFRLATNSQNCANGKCRTTNRSGLKGVTRNGAGFMAQINVRNKHIYLGTFKTATKAHRVYVEAARRGFGEFARSR